VSGANENAEKVASYINYPDASPADALAALDALVAELDAAVERAERAERERDEARQEDVWKWRHDRMKERAERAERELADKERAYTNELVMVCEVERNAAEARVEQLEAALQGEADKGCWWVNDGQPPECAEEWPDRKQQWCVSCFAAAALSGLGDAG